MSVEIQKPIDRAYLLKQLELLTGHELYELLKDQTIIDQPENYTKCSPSEPNAIEVTSTNILDIVAYVSDIRVGDYVLHQEEISHTEDVIAEKYARRQSEGMSDEDMDDMWSGGGEVINPNKKFIDDDVTSLAYTWSSTKINDEIKDAVSNIDLMSIEVVTALPSNPKQNVLYVLDDATHTLPIWVYNSTTGWKDTGVKLNNIDLSTYAKKDDVVNKKQDVADAGKALIVGTDGNVTTGDVSTKVSADTGNQITTKTDGLYVPATPIDISADADNQISKKTDGLFVPKVDLSAYAKSADVVAKDQTAANKGKTLVVGDDGMVTLGDAAIKVSAVSGNQIVTKTDGIYVAAAQVDVSVDTDNQITKKTDGLFVPKTDLSNYVEKETGKGLSTNDLTDTLKAQYDKAEENVQSDWNQTDTSKDDYIKNKPTIPTVDSAISSTSTNALQNKVIKEELDKKVDKETGKGLSTNDLTDALKTSYDGAVTDKHTHSNKTQLDKFGENTDGKLTYNGNEVGGVQIQADFNQTDNTKADFIKNKPTVDATYSATSDNAQSGKAVASAISTEIGKLTYLSKVIATKTDIDGYVADPTTAKFNTIYLLKDASATGTDKYFEYQRLGDDTSSTFECTGDTSTDLTDYAKSTDVVAKSQGTTNAGKPLVVGTDGNVSLGDAPIQADWNQTDSTKIDYIKNKPTIPAGAVVDQTYSATSENAQSGKAMATELTKYEKLIPAYTKAYYDAHKTDGTIPNGSYFCILDD